MYGAPFGSKRFSFLFLTSLFNVLFFGLFSLSFLYYSPTPPKIQSLFSPFSILFFNSESVVFQFHTTKNSCMHFTSDG